jgi:hypothetical protein
MSESTPFKQPNGHYFLAVNLSGWRWSKAQDPITAIKDAAGDQPNQAVACVYGKGVQCTGLGGFEWDMDTPPVPVGLFIASARGIRPIKANEKAYPKNSQSCEDWIATQNREFTEA